MKNEEIIIEGLKENLHLEPMGKERVRVCLYVHKKDFPKVASAILSKLQTLDEHNIRQIFKKYDKGKDAETGVVISYKDYDYLVSVLSRLIPEEGETFLIKAVIEDNNK